MGKRFALPLVVLLASPAAHAYSNFTPGNLSAMTNDLVNSLLETLAVGAVQRSYQPASTLGILGFDVGAEITAISLPADFQNALATATNEDTSQIPGLVPLPRLNARIGLPFALDVGASYTGYEDIFKSFGVDVKWGLPVHPLGFVDLAAQFTGNYTKLWFIGTHAYSLDALASMNLILFEPYIGFGLLNWEGDLDVPTGGTDGLPANVSAHLTGTTGHLFVGVPVKLLLIHITPQYDYGFAGVNTYGIKVSVSF